MEVLLEQVPLEQVPLVQILLIQIHGVRFLKKIASKFVILAKKTVTPNKNVTFDKIANNTLKDYPIMQAKNDKNKNLMLT